VLQGLGLVDSEVKSTICSKVAARLASLQCPTRFLKRVGIFEVPHQANRANRINHCLISARCPQLMRLPRLRRECLNNVGEILIAQAAL
jgi:hypothetical protein